MTGVLFGADCSSQEILGVLGGILLGCVWFFSSSVSVEESVSGVGVQMAIVAVERVVLVDEIRVVMVGIGNRLGGGNGGGEGGSVISSRRRRLWVRGGSMNSCLVAVGVVCEQEGW